MHRPCQIARPFFIILAGFLFVGSITAATDQTQPSDLISIAHGAESDSAEGARLIALALLKTPDDPILHAKLLGHCLVQKSDTRIDRLKQIIWMIDHEASDPIAGSIYCLIDAADEPEGYARAKADWDHQLVAHPADVGILGNAAAFLTRSNFAEAESLLQQAMALEPKNPIWPERLALLYEGQINGHPDDAARFSMLAVQARQSVYNLTKDPTYRFHVMLQMPTDALRGGDLIQAKRSATQLLGTASKFKGDPVYGDAVHQANIILGEIALQGGNVDQADEYLAAAGQTPGSATLSITGPNFQLAKELLTRGERIAVRGYLAACGKFWTNGDARLKSWMATLDAGGTPNF